MGEPAAGRSFALQLDTGELLRLPLTVDPVADPAATAAPVAEVAAKADPAASEADGAVAIPTEEAKGKPTSTLQPCCYI